MQTRDFVLFSSRIFESILNHCGCESGNFFNISPCRVSPKKTQSNVHLKPISNFRFVRKQNENIQGITESARARRRNKNLVNMKFNMINWALETFTTFLVFIFPHEIVLLIYWLVNCCGTPLVYFMGIEENRKATKKLLMSKIRIIKKNQISPVNAAENDN